jgi:hypothetical protein
MLNFLYLFMQYNLSNLIWNSNPIFKLIDRYKKQPDNYSKNRETPLPAAYIEIKKSTNILEWGGMMTQSEFDVRVHIAVERYIGTEMGDANQLEALNLYYIMDRVSTLYGMSSESIDKLNKEYLYFPPSGTTITDQNGSSLYYGGYDDYEIGYLHLVDMEDVSGRYDDLDVYEVNYKVKVNTAVNMPHYIQLTGVTYALSGVTFRM